MYVGSLTLLPFTTSVCNVELHNSILRSVSDAVAMLFIHSIDLTKTLGDPVLLLVPGKSPLFWFAWYVHVLTTRFFSVEVAFTDNHSATWRRTSYIDQYIGAGFAPVCFLLLLKPTPKSLNIHASR